MLKLYRKLSKIDILFVILILGLTVLQVYCTMTLVDYVGGIVKAITYINYHNNPESIPMFGDQVKALVDNIGWEGIKASADMYGEAKDMVISIADASQGDIWFNGGMMLILAASTMVIQAIIAIFASIVAADLSTKIRKDLYTKINEFSLEEIDKFQTASLVTRTTNDIQHIQFANLLTMRMIFQVPVTIVWAILKIQATSFELTMSTVVAILALIVVIGFLMIFALPKFKIMQKLTDNLNGVTRDNLMGIRIIRAYNAEDYQENKFEKANTTFTKTQLFTGRAMTILSPFIMLVMNALSLAMYIIGAKLINKGDINYSTVTAFVMLGTQLVMSFLMLMMLFILWPRALVAANRINEVLETKPSITNPKNPKDFIDQGTVEFKNVSFKYPNGEDYVIENINFKINKGETLAIIGATSSGKTSLVNLISRLYDATDGEVLVDGVNVKELDIKNLRSKIGFVPQKGFLFNGTIKDNIAFSDQEPNMELVEYSAKIACCDEFIDNLDEKYEYKISESGKNVSGGQRQRLCIARCVYLKPEIYVFDDSFSALDYKTDKKLRSNLNELDSSSTKIIVAQRIGTIMDADKIIVLDNGKIVGMGKHKELLDNPVYREIALSQLSREELGLHE